MTFEQFNEPSNEIMLLDIIAMRDKEIDQLKAELAQYQKAVVSIRNEFDLWADDSQFSDIIEAQIDNFEALRGEP
jgi:Holliday junction resolvase RusA-like endonuclease